MSRARLNSRQELEQLRQELSSRRDPDKPSISVCAGSGCLAGGASEVISAFRDEIENQGLTGHADIRSTGCHGFCEKGPIVVIDPEETCYLQVTPKDVSELTSRALKEKKIVDRLLYVDPVTGEKTTRESDIPFYKHQRRLVLGPNRKIDPRAIEDYIAIGGYRALAKALFEMTPQQVIGRGEGVEAAGARRGGFPDGSEVGVRPQRPGRAEVCRGQLLTRETREPTWTGLSWKAILIV